MDLASLPPAADWLRKTADHIEQVGLYKGDLASPEGYPQNEQQQFLEQRHYNDPDWLKTCQKCTLGAFYYVATGTVAPPTRAFLNERGVETEGMGKRIPYGTDDYREYDAIYYRTEATLDLINDAVAEKWQDPQGNPMFDCVPDFNDDDNITQEAVVRSIRRAAELAEE